VGWKGDMGKKMEGDNDTEVYVTKVEASHRIPTDLYL
jgi:hypothetical protein